MSTRHRFTSCLALACMLLTGAAATADTAPPPRWHWPVDGPKEAAEPFRAPAHRFGAGHRGVDLAAPVGATIRAPADGIVAFRGVVVDRPVLTIAHADDHVTSWEPLESTLSVGESVREGDAIGTVGSGGHAAAGHLHLGVRVGGAYVDPMLLFGAAERAVLLPCCAPL